MIPANILDRAGAGGGSPEPAVAPPAAPQPTPPAAQAAQPAVPQHAAELMVHPKPRPVEKQPEPKPEPEPEPEPRPEAKPERETSKEPAIKPARAPHEVHPTFDPVKTSSRERTKIKPASEPAVSESKTSSTDARRIQHQLSQAMDVLANNVKNSGASGTVVDMPGQGGGEAFAGYETVIYNAYYHAWIAPDSVADKLAATDVKIVVARDGTILSADIVNKSSERALDKSVDRALRAVTRLQAFPAGARDEQRTFIIRFNLSSKEGSG